MDGIIIQQLFYESDNGVKCVLTMKFQKTLHTKIILKMNILKVRFSKNYLKTVRQTEVGRV